MASMVTVVTAIRYGVKNVRGFSYNHLNPNNAAVISRLIFEPELFEEKGESWKMYKDFKPYPKSFTYF